MKHDYVYMSEDDSRGYIDELVAAPVLAFDVETTGVDIGISYPLGFSLAYKPKGAYYTDARNEFFKAVLASETRLKIAHNAKFDRSMVKKLGLRMDNLCCTMIAAHLLELESLSLQTVAGLYARESVPVFRELSKPVQELSLTEAAQYSCPHSAVLFPVWKALEARLRKYDLLDVFWGIEMPLVPVLSDMELNGVMVDPGRLVELGGYFDEKLEILTQGLDHWAEGVTINHNSPDQVAYLLFDKLGLPPTRFKTAKERPSVNAKLLEGIKDSHSYIPLYFVYKKYKKLKSTYVDGLLKEIMNGRVHGSFNQTRTRTSRLSSSDPNLQNIPERAEEGRKIRTAFVAPEGKVLLKVDYDLLELKAMAHCSQDPSLLSAFREGRDVHEETAIRAYGDKSRRREAKTLDYRIIYGGGSPEDKAMFFTAYPQVEKWTTDTAKKAMDAGYVRTLGGRIRCIEELWSDSPRVRAHGIREAISTIIQGTSAEVVKVGMRRLWEKVRDSEVKMVLQVHDEVVLEVPIPLVQDVVGVIRETMPYNEFSVPLTVSISVGKNWGTMEKVK